MVQLYTSRENSRHAWESKANTPYVYLEMLDASPPSHSSLGDVEDVNKLEPELVKENAVADLNAQTPSKLI